MPDTPVLQDIINTAITNVVGEGKRFENIAALDGMVNYLCQLLSVPVPVSYKTGKKGLTREQTIILDAVFDFEGQGQRDFLAAVAAKPSAGRHAVDEFRPNVRKPAAPITLEGVKSLIDAKRSEERVAREEAEEGKRKKGSPPAQQPDIPSNSLPKKKRELPAHSPDLAKASLRNIVSNISVRRTRMDFIRLLLENLGKAGAPEASPRIRINRQELINAICHHAKKPDDATQLKEIFEYMCESKPVHFEIEMAQWVADYTFPGLEEKAFRERLVTALSLPEKQYDDWAKKQPPLTINAVDAILTRDATPSYSRA